MFPPFLCPSSPEEARKTRRRYQERKLRTLSFWRDGLERQLAALQAAISTLEQQIARE
ncbi:sigma factor SigF [Cyanobium sp. Morenito 9A2]|uniref:sigma factor SigF n=1 Tax=Cyanobium sp. Morenito 9A2 TaxID=2823718 RepID=UPI0020CE9EF2|nr:sigma factor SigF [Cyanobium sp. Morenito 9A2]MCP9850057.1 sigma factor SigF [Cyanobium sp. Morenito 9A2]